MARYPKLRDDLVSSPAEIDGQTVYNIRDPRTGNYFRLREPEFWLISQFDGNTSAEHIAEAFRSKYGMNISAEDVLSFARTLDDQFFLEDQRSEQELARKIRSRSEHESLFSRLLFIKLTAYKPGRLLDLLTAIYRPFHNRASLLLMFIVMIAGVILLFANRANFDVNMYELFNVESLATIILAIFIMLVLHEFAHAVVCRHFGGQVNEMGFLLLYFQPCFYCDLSDAWMFREKRQRLAVTFAGPFFQLFVLAVAVVVWRVTVAYSFVNELARIVAIVAWISLLLNFNPLIKLDGYYLLSDWLDIPNLRKKSFTYFGNLLQRVVLGWPVKRPETTPWERRVYIAYAVFAMAYSIFLVVYILGLLAGFLVDKMGGIGLLLLAVVLLYTLRSSVVSLTRGCFQHIVYMKDIMRRPLRLTVYVVVTLVLVGTVFLLPLPHRVTGEITVRPIAEFNLLLNEFGMLEKRFVRGGAESENKSSFLQTTTTEMASLELLPRVSDGQHVSVGDTLALMISNQVVSEIVAERSVLEKLESDLALLRSPPKPEEVNQAQADVSAAEAAYEQRLREQKRTQELADRSLVSREVLETAQSATQIARAELENKRARLQLLKSPPKPEEEAVIISEIEKQRAKLSFLESQLDAQSIIAPISGTIAIHQDQDQFLSIVSVDTIEVLVPVSDFDIELVKLGQHVKVKVRSFTDRVFVGQVVHIPKTAEINDEKSRFYVSSVVANDSFILRKGMSGYAKIEVGETTVFRWLLRKLTSTIRVEFWSWW